MTEFAIVPNEGQNYKGRQWGYTITRDGQPFLRAVTGGTGDCWNIESLETFSIDPETGDEEHDQVHVCELGEFVAALQTLLDSDAHKEHVARWAGP